MAEPSDLTAEVVAVADELALAPAPGTGPRQGEKNSARRTKAMSLRLAGFSYAQIGEQLEITEGGARDMIRRSLDRAENRVVAEERELENARLDRAQSAIWSKVLQGDLKAIDTYLRISQQRSRINGLNAETKLSVSVGIRNEMEDALTNLEKMVLQGAEVIRGDVMDQGWAEDDAASAARAFSDLNEGQDNADAG